MSTEDEEKAEKAIFLSISGGLNYEAEITLAQAAQILAALTSQSSELSGGITVGGTS